MDESLDYLPLGEQIRTDIHDTQHEFTGKERDAETGLDYLGARYYANALGRFITPDWAAKATAVPYTEFTDPGSSNLYTYVRNIPTVKFDPDGHEDGSFYEKYIQPVVCECQEAKPAPAVQNAAVGVMAIVLKPPKNPGTADGERTGKAQLGRSSLNPAVLAYG